MAVAIRASSTSTTGSTSIDPGKPTGTVATDVLVAFISTALGNDITAPSGWTLIQNTLSTARMKSFWALGNVASTSFTFASDAPSASIHALSGADNTTPVNISSSNGTNGASVTALSVTTTVDACLELAGFGSDANGDVGAFTGVAVTLVTNIGGSVAGTALQYVGQRTQATAGATGDSTMAVIGALPSLGQQIAIAPAAAGGATPSRPTGVRTVIQSINRLASFFRVLIPRIA